MLLDSIWLTNFRNHYSTELSFSSGTTVVTGANGQGKTNLLEAIAYVGSLTSFRGAANDVLIASDKEMAVIRAELMHGQRKLLIEVELSRHGRSRMQLNRQRVVKSRDITGLIAVTIFSPDDLVLIKGGPVNRRQYLDDLLATQNVSDQALRGDFDKVLRQRNTLLKQAGGGRSGGRLSEELLNTLAVFDTKFVQLGEALVKAREELVLALQPQVSEQFLAIAAGEDARRDTSMTYEGPWRSTGLETALRNSRADDLRRGVSTVGPHRDDLLLKIGGLDARTHASQGEQRSFALALRLGAQRLITQNKQIAPLMLLDDVFSELDSERAAALVKHLPEGQTVITTTGVLPPGIVCDRELHVHQGNVKQSHM